MFLDVLVHEGTKDRDALRAYKGGQNGVNYEENFNDNHWHLCPGPNSKPPTEQSYVTGFRAFTDDEHKQESKEMGNWPGGSLDLDDYGIIKIEFVCKTKAGR